MTRTLLLLTTLTTLTACTPEELALYTDPTDPDWVTVDATCDSGALELVAFIDGDLPTTNVTLVPVNADGTVLDMVYPINDLTQGDGSITRWTVTLDHDCEAPLELQWSAYTFMETEAHLTTQYPIVPPEADSITPPWGTTAGGSVVQIIGEFVANVEAVTFGDASATLLTATEDSLEVETPPNAAGSVDVVLTGGGTSTTLPDAFEYYEDQSDLYRGIVKFEVAFYNESLLSYDSAYGAIDGPYAQFEVLLHAPVPAEEHYWRHLPSPGECGYSSADILERDTIGPYMSATDVSGDMGRFILRLKEETSVYWMLAGDVTEADWLNTQFDLTLPESLEDLPAMVVPDGVWTAPRPEALNIDWSIGYTITRGNDIPITFIPSDDLDLAIVTTVLQRSDTSEISRIACAYDPSTGDMTIPWDALVDGADPDEVAEVYLKIEFLRDQRIVLPHDQSMLWAYGVASSWNRIAVVD
jgi:hypothetical protein